MSPHFQVAERALFLWNNEYIVQQITTFRTQVCGAPPQPSQELLGGAKSSVIMEMGVGEDEQREWA